MAGNRRIYKLLWAVHSWTGLYVGLVVAILSVSGSAVVFQDDIDALLNPSLLRVTSSAGRASITAVTDSILERYGHRYALNAIRFPSSDHGVLQVDMVSTGGGSLEIRQVLADPYTGALIGDREYTKTLAYYLRHLHVRGFQARYGRQFVGFFGLALLVSSITGLAIYGNFMRSMRFGTIRWGQGLRVVSADWHKVVGISALAFNLVIAVTGAWLGWSAEALRLAGTQPDGSLLPMLARAGRIVTPSDDAAIRVDVDTVLAVARRARPGFEPRSLNMTRDGRRQVVMFGAPRSDLYAASTNKVLVDKQTLAVTAAFDISEAGAGSKLYYLMEPLHFGTFGGTALKIAYGVFGITAGVLSITGFLVYWKRREGKDSPPSRVTASRSLVRWSLLAVCTTVLTLGASLTIGPLYPSTAVSVLTLLWPLWLAVRFIRTGWRERWGQRRA
jgi:uncharacterized iron-regulated membrane protein